MREFFDRGGHRDRVIGVLRALAVRENRRWEWFGVPIRSSLVELLYERFYCRGRAVPQPMKGGPARTASSRGLVAALSEANRGEGYWDPGWKVIARHNGTVVVRKNDLELWPSPEECRTSSDPAGAEGNAWVRLPPERLQRAPGFYVAIGDAGPSSGRSCVRLYWNVKPQGAPSLLGMATGRLNAEGVPFTLKVVDNPTRYARRDAAVLYVRPTDFAVVRRVVLDFDPTRRFGLRPGVPAFTKRLASGVGLAEDPETGESFGKNRCRLLSEGILRAHQEGNLSVDGRLRAVEEHFAGAGIRLEAPYLNPGSRDEYESVRRQRRVAGR